MSGHPLNIRKQLLMYDESIDRVRLTRVGDRFEYFIKTNESVDRAAILKRVKSYLKENQIVCSTQIIIDEWEDGPDIPSEYTELEDFVKLELEGNDPTCLGLSNTLPRLIPNIRSVEVQDEAGKVRIILYPREGELPPETPDYCAKITRLITPVPLRTVDVEVKYEEPPVLEEPDKHFMLHGIVISKYGIRDKELLTLHESDEAKFTEAAKRNFFLGLEDIKPLLVDGRSTCYFPYGNFTKGALRTAFLFFQRAIVALPFKESDPEYLNDLVGDDFNGFLKAVRDGYIIPLIGQRLGRYDERILRAVIETGNFITPRETSISLASDLVVRTPALTVYLHEPDLAIHSLKDFGRFVNSLEAKDQGHGLTSSFIKVYLNTLNTMLTNFYYDISNFGIIAATYQGPGPLGTELLRYFKEINPSQLKEIPELELAVTGGDISVATAFNSTCIEFPPYFHRIYQYLCFLHSNGLETGFDIKPSRTGVMDGIVTGLEINIRPDISISDWVQLLNECGIERTRQTFNLIGNKLDIDNLNTIKEQASAWGKSVNRFIKRRGTAKRLINKFDLCGLVSGSVTAFIPTQGLTGPLILTPAIVGWALGLLIKHLSPFLWDQISKYEFGNDVTGIIESVITAKTPKVVRLGRFMGKLGHLN